MFPALGRRYMEWARSLWCADVLIIPWIFTAWAIRTAASKSSMRLGIGVFAVQSLSTAASGTSRMLSAIVGASPAFVEWSLRIHSMRSCTAIGTSTATAVGSVFSEIWIAWRCRGRSTSWAILFYRSIDPLKFIQFIFLLRNENVMLAPSFFYLMRQ